MKRIPGFHPINPHTWAMRDRFGRRWPGFDDPLVRLWYRAQVLWAHRRFFR